MIRRPLDIGSFQFVALATLRAKQLARGCVPRVATGYTLATTAQREVAERKVIAEAGPEMPAYGPMPVFAPGT